MFFANSRLRFWHDLSFYCVAERRDPAFQNRQRFRILHPERGARVLSLEMREDPGLEREFWRRYGNDSFSLFPNALPESQLWQSTRFGGQFTYLAAFLIRRDLVVFEDRSLRLRAKAPTTLNKEPEEPLPADDPHNEWIRFELVDAEGKAMSGVDCELELPDGTKTTKTTESDGSFEVRHLQRGQVRLTPRPRSAPTTHQVTKGECLVTIAQHYFVSPSQLQVQSPSQPGPQNTPVKPHANFVSPGQRCTVPPSRPMARSFSTGNKHRLRFGESRLVGCCIRFLYSDPRSQEQRPLPEGIDVVLEDGLAKTEIARAKTNLDGIVQMAIAADSQDLRVVLDVGPGGIWIELDNDVLPGKQALDPKHARSLIWLGPWRSDEQPGFIDDRGGRFLQGRLAEVKEHEQGLPLEPWPILIDYGWRKQYLQFDYFDTRAKDSKALECGLRVELVEGKYGAKKQQIAGSTILDESGLVYLSFLDSKPAPQPVEVVAFSGTNYFYSTAKSVRSSKVQTLSTKQWEQLPVKKRREQYPLPSVWTSDGQIGRHPQGDFEYLNQFPIEISSPKERLRFHLDDYLLVDTNMNQVQTPNPNSTDLTVLDHRMGVIHRDFNYKYRSKLKVHPTAQPAESHYFVAGKDGDHVARVVRYEGKFYDLTHRRCTQGPAIGARAAVESDHPFQKIQGVPVPGVGNYECHYFDRCMVDSAGNKEVSHLLVFWSASFQKNPDPTKSSQVTQLDVDSFENALHNVTERFEGRHPSEPTRKRGHKRYVITERGGKGALKIHVRFLLVATSKSLAHCDVLINDAGFGRDWMAPNNAEFDANSHLISTQSKNTVDTDGLVFPWFTFAHEVGHALGLDDEYIEPIIIPGTSPGSEWRAPILPNADQHGSYKHYSSDDKSLMESNRGTRLRHFWPLVRWLQQYPGTQKLPGIKNLEVNYEKSRPQMYFQLPLSRPDFYRPVYSSKSIINGTGFLDLALFDTVLDETHALWSSGITDIDSVLQVQIRFLLDASFANSGTSPIPPTTLESFLRRIQGLFEKLNGTAGGSPILLRPQSGGGKTFRKVIVQFQPRYNFAPQTGLNNHHELGYTKGQYSIRALNPGSASQILNPIQSFAAAETVKYSSGISTLAVKKKKEKK